MNKIKKIATLLFDFLLVVNLTSIKVKADASTTIDGIGYVVRGSINAERLSGSVGGKASNEYPTVTLIGDVYIRGSSGQTKRVQSKAGTTYCTYNINDVKYDNKGRRITADKWYRGYVSARISGLDKVIKTKLMDFTILEESQK